MTIKELKERLNEAPDDAEVIIDLPEVCLKIGSMEVGVKIEHSFLITTWQTKSEDGKFFCNSYV